MNIAIVGGAGNMGRRYELILKYLGVNPHIIDVGKEPVVKNFDGVIIATPTETHVKLVEDWASKNIPILCEKPISTCVDAVKELCKSRKLKLRMINQYEKFEQERIAESKIIKVMGTPGPQMATFYDYFKTGNDGLAWDCINIIGLANGSVHVQDSSVVWRCVINGKILTLDMIDHAYIWNIKDWLDKKDNNKKYIRHAHDAVERYINDQSSSRNTGKTF